MPMSAEGNHAVREFYRQYHDPIFTKRYNSPFWLRRYVHRTIYEGFLRRVQPRMQVVDAGCGEGVLSLLMARKGAVVTAADISEPNIQVAHRLAKAEGLSIRFVQGSAEDLPFREESFDLVVSSHVLEHLPHLYTGLRELRRVARGAVLIAMPTCFNPAAWALLGGDPYWQLSRRSLVAVPLGLLRTLTALLRGEQGPNEGYGGNAELPHIWRFPWIMRRQIEEAGLQIVGWEAGPLVFPYLAEYVPLLRRLQPWLDRWGAKPIVRYLGCGSLVICER